MYTCIIIYIYIYMFSPTFIQSPAKVVSLCLLMPL